MITKATILQQNNLEQYLKSDWILKWLESYSKWRDRHATTHKWLVESAPKRMIYSMLYGDLISLEGSRGILDIGGGYCSLSRLLAKKHIYFLIDLQKSGRDWYKFNAMGTYDIVIANDLFPNVDQRLELFLAKFLPICKEMRLSLTYFDKPHWYTLKKTEGDEILTMLAWTGRQTRRILDKYNSTQVDLDFMETDIPSIFPNGRQVAIVTMKGGAS